MVSDRQYETLLYEESDGVAWVTMNRPEVLNCFNAKMQLELRDLWTGLRRDDDVRVIVLTGAGDRAFCTGIDRTEQLGGDNPGEDRIVGRLSSPFMFDDPGPNICPKQCGLWKPIIAAVNGMACGGAFYMLGECEFIIAADHATFFDPHVTYGMTASFESIHMLQKMPMGEIMRLALLGNHERMSAQRAFQIGMATEVVPLEKLREAAGWAAARIASAPKDAIDGTVRAIWAGQEHSWRQALELAYAYVNLGNSGDALAEGQRAFESGERPDWHLR
jgi:enoyl-CoA hydratase/carnithine racemase